MEQTNYFIKLFVGSIALLLLIAASSCTLSSSDKINLSGTWEYTYSQKGYESIQTVLAKDFYPLPPTSLNSLSIFLPEKTGFLWLKYTVPIERSFIIQNPQLALYLGRITMADETYFNGVLIGSEGRFPPNVFSAWNKFRMYRIPQEIIKYNELNTILIKIYIDKEGSLTGKPFIASISTAQQQYAIDTFINSTVNLIASGIMLIAGIYHIIIWLKRKKETESLYFALLNILGAIYLSNFYLYDTFLFNAFTIDWLWFQKIIANMLIYIIGYIICNFIISLLKLREYRIFQILRLLLLIVPIVWILIIPDYSELYNKRLYLQLFIIPVIFYILGLVVLSVIKKNPAGRIVIFGMIPLFATSLFDIIIHSVFKMYDFPYLAGFGFPLVILSIFFLLASRFASSLTEVEELNLHLEDKVKQRTAELQNANQQLSETLSQLREAQYIAERDLKMATYVQTSFYPKAAPQTKYWTTGYFFKPAAAVAGDLYDFYVKNNELHGVGIFDVSGHGIASGLVTMLAKTIIFHNFSEHISKKLHEVLAIINNQIIKNKGDIENYLTGILLRINEYIVEYVNAGHVDLLFCNGATGTVIPVVDEKNQAKGMFLGIPDLPCEAHTLRFKVKPGDILCLYTDGITEAKNPKGEMFGENRLYSLIERNKMLGAEDIAETIQKAFIAFKQDAPLTDDATLIILKAK